MGLRIHHCGVLSQHGSKAGSNGTSVNCSSCVHAWPESSGTAAEDCRREGCIRHRLTLAHQDRPKPHASRARLPEGVGLLWANPRGKSYDNSHQGHRGWALSSTFVALSQHGSKAGSNGRSVNCSSCVHAWPESSGTAAEDCRREGCIRHRLTLAHQDRPKPHRAGPAEDCRREGVADTVSQWRTRTARNHMPAGPGCQRGLVFYGPIQGEKAMTTVIRGIVGGPYHPPLWRCHSTEAKQVAMTGQLMATILAHTWRESSGTAAQDCRCEGCIPHRLTLAHHDRPKPHARRARLPEGVGLSKGEKRRQKSSGAS